MWWKKKPQPVPVSAPTAEQLEAKRLDHEARVASWRANNPLNKYLITFKDSTIRVIAAHGYMISPKGLKEEIKISFYKYLWDDDYSPWNPKRTIFFCWGDQVVSIQLLQGEPK